MTVASFLGVKTFVTGLIFAFGLHCSGASWLDVKSPDFTSALKYGFAQALYSATDLTCWSPELGEERFQVTQDLHDRLGKSVEVDIIGRAELDGSLSFHVFFPGFEIGSRQLVLHFKAEKGEYFYLGQSFEKQYVRFDFSEKQMDFVLPKNPRSIVKSEFSPKQGDLSRLEAWCGEMLQEAYPEQERGTSHFFVAPYSLRYDSFSVSVYWVEGRRIIQLEQLEHPDGHSLKWRELHDYNAEFPMDDSVDHAFERSRDLRVARHVIDGLLLTVTLADQ